MQLGEEHYVQEVRPPAGVHRSPEFLDPRPLSETSSPELSL